jgi:bis(5'-nucleosyl)-tetraphosphatase (symmetrical)
MLKPDGRVEPDYDGPPAGAPPGCVAWFQVPDAAWATHTVVFGHWAALGLDLGRHHIALDTGCVWGRQLTAIRLDDRMVFQVKAVETAT